MTAAALPPSVQYTENGVTTVFAVGFRFKPVNLKAKRISAAGVVTNLVYGTDYSASGGETDAGGSLTVIVPGVAGTRLKIRRVTPRAQTMDYTTGDTFPAESHEGALDTAMLIDQEQDVEISDTAQRAVLVPEGETASLLPFGAPAANKLLGFDATGTQLLPVAANGGADAALRVDLATPASGLALIGMPQHIAGAKLESLYFFIVRQPVPVHRGLWVGEDIAVDAGPAARRILAAGEVLLAQAGQEYIVAPDPASALPGGLFEWALNFGTGARVVCEESSKFKLANNAPGTCKVVVIEGSEIDVSGELWVDGNVDNINLALANEFMHGVHIYDARKFNIQAIRAEHTRGDGVLIAGTDDTVGSNNGSIDRIIVARSGRKNLVWQALHKIHISLADLDNTQGGASLYGGVADNTDKNCFDVEPDVFTGIVENSGRIDHLITRGGGNDFTGPQDPALAKKHRTSIGKWDNEIVAVAGTKWFQQQGGYLEIDTWTVRGVTAICGQAECQYGAQLDVKSGDIEGAAVDAASSFFTVNAVDFGGSTRRPNVSFHKLRLIVTSGRGFEGRDCDLHFGRLHAETNQDAIWLRGLSANAAIRATLHIGHLSTINSGDPASINRIITISKDGAAQSYCTINSIDCRDTRGTKTPNVVFAGPGASAGIYVGGFSSPDGVALFGAVGPDKYYRISGGGEGAPASFVTLADPDTTLPAPLYSTCHYVGNSFRKKTGGGSGLGVWTAL